MTLSSTAQKIGDRLPSADEKATANQLRKILASQLSSGKNQVLTALDAAGTRADIVLTPAISELLIELLRHIGKGDAGTAWSADIGGSKPMTYSTTSSRGTSHGPLLCLGWLKWMRI